MTMNNTSNPLAPNQMQKANGRNGKEVVLTSAQRMHLRRTGLLAEAHETWTHPSGAFTLTTTPHHGSRQRVSANGVTAFTSARNCRRCHTEFMPHRSVDLFCSAVCFTKSQNGR